MTAVCLAGAAAGVRPVRGADLAVRGALGRVLGSLAALGVLCTAIAFVLFFQLIAEVGPARATVITYVNPAVAVALGVSVLGEPLTPAIVAAFVLILTGSVLATRSGLPRPRPTPGPRPCGWLRKLGRGLIQDLSTLAASAGSGTEWAAATQHATRLTGD